MKNAFSLPSGLLLCGLALFFSACDGFFGTKTDDSFLGQQQYDNRQVAYVPIQPVLGGFTNPVDVIAGWDELIYVADAGTEQIISFDQAGNEQGRFKVQGLKAIAQDRRLDLLALGTRDTTVNGVDYRLPAIYRIDQNQQGTRGNGLYGLLNAAISKTVTHPFYFKSGTPASSDAGASFEGIAILGDNRYYVTRNGVGKSPTFGPDDAVLLFSAADKFITAVAINTSLGLFNDYFRKPKGIATEIAPPQTPSVSLTNGNFVFTSTDAATPLKAQVVQYTESEFGADFSVKQLTAGDTTQADGFMYENQRFTAPQDVCFAGDGTNYYFIVDAARDSLYQFTAKGYEGVNPPPGYNGTKVIKASFGGHGAGLTQFDRPSGVAYLNRIVYVADAGNKRVLRFKLTTDFE